MLTIKSCERIPAGPDAGRMTAAEFVAALPAVPYPIQWFADITGTNTRTVEYWISGEREIPFWVPRFLTVRTRLAEGLAWSARHVEYGTELPGEAEWRVAAWQAVWAKDSEMLEARARQREARRGQDSLKNPASQSSGSPDRSPGTERLAP